MQDDARRHGLIDAAGEHERRVAAFAAPGDRTHVLPMVPVGQRAAFVSARLAP